MKKFILSVAFVVMLFPGSAAAQEEKKSTMFNGSTNLQLLYDFGGDRKCVTSTIEGFYNDPWGNTFFFIDHDYKSKNSEGEQAMNGTYWEIARCLNFWSNSKANFLSLQVEYNGGVYRGYGINHSFLGGADFFVHNSNFSNTFNFKILYKYIMGQKGNVPLQFTFVWGMQDIFNVKGLRFSGFADIWGEKHTVYPVNMSDGTTDWTQGTEAAFIFLSEPQLWYSVGQHFGCPNLNLGGEVELSANFGTGKGFLVRPCLGLKWVF